MSSYPTCNLVVSTRQTPLMATSRCHHRIFILTRRPIPASAPRIRPPPIRPPRCWAHAGERILNRAASEADEIRASGIAPITVRTTAGADLYLQQAPDTSTPARKTMFKWWASLPIMRTPRLCEVGPPECRRDPDSSGVGLHIIASRRDESLRR
jgi:hypothetical protein